VGKGMSSRILAIDIQQDQISCVLLTHDFKGVRILESACMGIVRETKADKHFKAIQTALSQVLGKISDKYDKCIISLPSLYFFFRILDLPFKNRKKNSQILSFELEAYLPCPVEDVDSDFYLFDKNSTINDRTNMAGTASIRTQDLENFKSLFKACNINPDMVTTGGGYSSALVYAGTSDPETFSLFINMEEGLLSIYAVRFGEIAFIRTIGVNAIDPVQSVITNINHTLLSFNESSNNSSELEKIVVSGTASFLPTLRIDIENRIKVPLETFDIFKTPKKIPVLGQFTDKNSDLTHNAIAMGVNYVKAVEGFNFTRQISDLALFYHENRANTVAVAVLCVLLFFAWAVNPILTTQRMGKNIQQLDTSITQVFKSCFPDVQTIVDPVHQMKVKLKALQEKKNIAVFNPYPLCIDLLDEISRALPPALDIDFSRFVRTENNLLVAGSADQFKTIDKMKTYFKNIELFKKVDINSASMDKMDKRVKFNLKILL
jgi:general secretion pathway protein L